MNKGIYVEMEDCVILSDWSLFIVRLKEKVRKFIFLDAQPIDTVDDAYDLRTDIEHLLKILAKKSRKKKFHLIGFLINDPLGRGKSGALVTTSEIVGIEETDDPNTKIITTASGAKSAAKVGYSYRAEFY